MSVSVFSATATEVYAAADVSSIFSVENTSFKNDKITYTISIAPNQNKLLGTVIKAEFDSEVLEVSSESGPVGTINDFGEFAANITGYYEKGVNYDDKGAYSVVYMNPNGFNTGTKEKQFISIVFKATGDKRPKTTVNFYCEEYVLDDGDNSNDIRKEDGRQCFYSHNFLPLNAAENVSVASVDGGLKFTWTEAAGAEEYYIYRKTEGTEWEKIHTASAGTTSYTDKTVEEGTEYYYTAQSVNSYGKRSYDEKGVVGMNFGTITGLNVKMTAKGATVSWNALKSASKYLVYRKSDVDTSYKRIGTTTLTSFDDEPLTSGIKYTYKVKAVHEKGYTAESANSPVNLTYIGNASIKFYQLNRNDIVINWEQVDGAEKYWVYRKAENEKSFTHIGSTKTNGYTDENVTDGVTYYYQVRCVTASDDRSVLDEAGYKLVKIPITSKVSASLGEDNITVSWASTTPADEYVVVRKAGSGGWVDIATVSATQTKYVDKSVKSGKTYSYAIKSKVGELETTLSAESASVYYLVAPNIKKVSNVSNGLKVTFEGVNGAEYYDIYRKKVGGKFAKIGRVASSDSKTYIDKTAESGVQYIYGVRSVYGSVKSSITSSSVSCHLAQPKVSLKNTYSGIKVSWKPVAGATHYIVYYGLSRDTASMTAVKKTTSTSYTYTKGSGARANYFAVVAACGDTRSTKSATSIYYLAPPIIKSVANGINMVTVRWGAVKGVNQYFVYRKIYGDSKWTRIAKTTDTSYKDYNVSSGKKYIYTVKGYDGEEFTPYNTKGWKIEFLKTPELKKITNTYNGPKVSWAKVPGATKYNVYRKTESTDWKYIGATKKTSYIDKNAASGKKYYYAVRATDGDNKSFYGENHFDSVSRSVKFLAAPVVSLAKTSSGVKVSWGSVSGATSYEVYRKAGSAKSWTKIKTTIFRNYVDKDVTSGKTYTYMVKAVEGSNVSGYKTDGVKIKYVR